MDKATVIASLLMPLILIFLYLTILKNVYVSSFTDLLPKGCVLPDRMTNGFILAGFLQDFWQPPALRFPSAQTSS